MSYQPLRWDCSVKGCFNKKIRLDTEVFYDCLPGDISFSDIDAIVEVNRHFLVQEWKSHMGGLSTGQFLMFERMTEHPNWTVWVVDGDMEHMVARHIKIFKDGKASEWEECSTAELCQKIEFWWMKAKRLNWHPKYGLLTKLYENRKQT